MRYAYFDFDGQELPALRRALAAAVRAADQNKTYRKKIDGSDLGDVEVTAVAGRQGEPLVTVTVQPYSDTAAAQDWDTTTESDFGTVPDHIEDDDDQTMRALTAAERETWQANIRADYQQWKTENPRPQPLLVHLSVAAALRLREQLTPARPAEPDGAL